MSGHTDLIYCPNLNSYGKWGGGGRWFEPHCDHLCSIYTGLHSSLNLLVKCSVEDISFFDFQKYSSI